MKNKDRQTLIQLVKQVQTMSACVSDFDSLMNRVESVSGSPEIGRLIFDPPGGKMLSAEEIVDLVVSKSGANK